MCNKMNKCNIKYQSLRDFGRCYKIFYFVDFAGFFMVENFNEQISE